MLLREVRSDRSGEYPTGLGTHARLHPYEPLPPWRTDVQTIRSSRGKEIIADHQKVIRNLSEKFSLIINYY